MKTYMTNNIYEKLGLSDYMERETNEETGEAEFYYYSKLLNEPFTTLEELKAAEEAYYTKEEDKVKKLKAEQAKKDEAADALQEAFSDYHIYNDAYTELITKAKTTREELLDVYYKALDDYKKLNPNGYHLELKEGNHTVTLHKDCKTAEKLGSNKKTAGAKSLSNLDLFDLFNLFK